MVMTLRSHTISVSYSNMSYARWSCQTLFLPRC